MTLSSQQRENARKSLSLILQALQDGRTQTAVAASLGWDDAKISRIKADRLEDLCELLSALNLRIVPDAAKTINEDKLKALLLLLADNITSETLYSKIVEG